MERAACCWRQRGGSGVFLERQLQTEGGGIFGRVTESELFRELEGKNELEVLQRKPAEVREDEGGNQLRRSLGRTKEF